jgi:hypothetical protein
MSFEAARSRVIAALELETRPDYPEPTGGLCGSDVRLPSLGFVEDAAHTGPWLLVSKARPPLSVCLRGVPIDPRLPAAPTMVVVRRTPEVVLPTIASVMIRAGLAPPPPAVAPARAPVERSTRWKRYHPYARASLPTRDMDDEYDVFAVS